MVITSASLLDLNALRNLEKTCFPQDAWPLLDLLAVLSLPRVVRLKAVEDGQMIGFIAGDQRPQEKTSWIATIAVLPEFQRQGIGAQLLAACEKECTLPIMRLSVRAENISAIRLYEKAGYYKVDVWVNYYNDGENALIMEKPLL